MKKQIFVLILVIVFIGIITTGCSDNNREVEINATNEIDAEVEQPQKPDSDIPDWFELPSISIESGIAESITKAEVGTTSYLFRGRTEEENIKLAQINETVALALKHEYGYSPPKGMVINFIEEKGVRVSELSLDEVDQMISSERTIINPDKVYSVGALFYGSSRNRLPAWLSAGLELYWSDRLGFERLEFNKDFDMNEWFTKTKDFSAFGDAWFEKNDDKTRMSVTFCFVKWLDENELLKELVTTYLDDKQVEGDLLFADAWQKFTGQDIRGDFCFEKRVRHLYGHYLQTNGNWDCYRYSYLTEQGHYLFDWLPRYNIVEEFLNNLDRQYVYAKQWLGYEDAAPIPTRISFDKGGKGAGGAEYVYLPGENPLVAVHEAFHHLLYARDIISYDVAWLNEGLPEGVQFIYADEDPEFYGAGFLGAFSKGDTDAFIAEISSLYHSLTGKEYEYNGTFDWKHYEHIKALEAVNYFIENDRYGSYSGNIGQLLTIRADDRPSTFPQGFLNTYPTAASFVIYMLEIGSKEDFMRLYADRSAAEEIYGKDFNALYEQWLEFLRQL